MIETYGSQLAVIGFVFCLFMALIGGSLIVVILCEFIADKLLQTEKKVHAYLRIRSLEREVEKLNKEIKGLKCNG